MDKKTIGFTFLFLVILGTAEYFREKRDIETHPPQSVPTATSNPQIGEVATPAPSGITRVETPKPMPTPVVRKVTPAPQIAVVTTPAPVRTPVATPKPLATPAWGKSKLDTSELEMNRKGKTR